MCNWNEILNQYDKFSSKDILLKKELSWLQKELSSINDEKDEEWNNLKDNVKQIKRVFWSKMAKKTVGYNNGVFRYEESIIDLYEAIESSLNKLDCSEIENIQMIRLKAHLCVIKRNINLYKDVRRVKDFHFEKLKSIIFDLLNCDLEKYFIEEINILYLESKLEIADRIVSGVYK